MKLTDYVCGSCAVASIGGLGEHANAKDAMQSFCRHAFGTKNEFRDTYNMLTCYYIFCAGPEVKSTEKGGSHHSKDHWPKYGTEFAAFIQDNMLGEVVTLGPKLNSRHHKTTTAQMWGWSPNQKAMEAWWDNNGGKLT